MKWIVGQPGGINGPFYSVVAENGNIIAMQIPSEKTAQTIAKLGPLLDYDFDTVQKAAKKLRAIFNYDEVKIEEGINDYLIRSVIMALFGDDYVVDMVTGKLQMKEWENET